MRSLRTSAFQLILLAALPVLFAASPASSQCNLPEPLEIDEFPTSSAVLELVGPSGTDRIHLTGPSIVHVAIGTGGEAADTDGDGLDQVRTEMVQLSGDGSSPLGPVHVEIRPASKDPFQCSRGEIEELANTQSGRLDLPPFAPGGSAISFFELYFEITIETPDGPVVLHNRVAKRMQTTIDHKPPDEGTIYENPQVIPLFHEDNTPSPFSIGASRHVPDCDQVAPACSSPSRTSNGIQVIVQDGDSGLFRIETTELTNARIDPPLSFALGTRSPVAVNAVKMDPNKSSRLALRITDACGNVTSCDPVLTLRIRETGKPESQTIGDLPQAESKLTVFNGSPGVRTLKIDVNGRKFLLTSLRDGEQRAVDLSPAMVAGDGNVVTLTAQGKPGGNVEVLIHD